MMSSQIVSSGGTAAALEALPPPADDLAVLALAGVHHLFRQVAAIGTLHGNRSQPTVMLRPSLGTIDFQAPGMSLGV